MTRGRALALLLAATAWPVGAGAAPEVTIRARTSLSLDPILRDEGGIRVRGLLHERGTAQPVPGGEVEIMLDGELVRFTTDEGGRFFAYFRTERGRRHRLAVQFPGEGAYDASSIEIPELDVSKRPVHLSVNAPGQHTRSSGPLEVALYAEDELNPASIPVTIHGGAFDLEPLPRLFELETDESGRATFSIPPEALDQPGPVRIEARFAGSALFDPARAHATVTVYSTTEVSFSPSAKTVRFEGRMRGGGRLLDDQGRGLSGQQVVLMVETDQGSRALDQTVTVDDGRFELEVRGSELGAGPHRVQAVFDPIQLFLEGSRSPVTPVVIEEKRPVPVGYSLAALAATATSILAFVGLRTRPWRRWFARLRQSGAPATSEPARQAGALPPTGLSLARPGLVSTLRRPHDHGFAGVVADAITRRPIAGASIALEGPGGGEPHGAESDATGSFAIEDLPPGTHRARVSSAGYVSEVFSVVVPHRGELRDARVDLLPVRERIFALYGDAARPLLPDPELWGVWTPRQIVDHVRQERPAPALAALTDYVEEKYFSIRVPDEEEIPLAAQQVEAARSEQRPDQRL
jgi:hypothetical protein